MSRPLIVLAGLPDLGRTLENAGVFPHVVQVGAVTELLAAFGSPELAQRRPDEVVLVFADTLKEDHSLPLIEVIRRLTGAGYPVIIVSVTARGADLSRQFPKAGLLPTPVRINDLLYAVNTFGYSIEPVAESAPQEPAAIGGWGSPPPSEPKQGGWQAVDEAPVQRQAPQAEPSRSWGGQEPQSTAPAQPARQPAPESQWGGQAPADRAPAPTGQPQWGGQAPSDTPRQERSGRPALFGTGSTPPDRAPAPTGQPQWGGQAPDGRAPEPTGQPQWGGQSPVPQAAPPSGQPQWGGQQSPAGTPGGWGAGPVSREGAYNAVPQAAGRRGHVITIAVSKGGTGKSSLTLNLGAFLGMRLRMLGKTVCVIDANFQQADAGKYLDCFTPNINTVANNPSLLTRERILEGLVHKPEYNLSVLLGPATPDEANPLNIDAELYTEILELLKFHFDYILIDTPVAEKYHDLFSKFVLPKADFIVVPVAPNFPTLHDAHNWLMSAVVQPRHSGGAGVDPSRIGVVLNRAEEGIGCSEEDVRSAMARWRFLGSIPETKEWKLANNRNELVAQKAYAELNQAFASILYEATGEAVLVANIEAPEEKRGIKALFDKIGKGRR